MSERIVFLYVTADKFESAKTIAKTLLEERLCACVNIYQNVYSLYHWQGKIEESPEVVMIVKTRESLAEKATERIKELHTYTCPCVAKLEVEILFKPYEEWLLAETRG
jgi:periplasmic divalent cation tolerance protein